MVVVLIVDTWNFHNVHDVSVKHTTYSAVEYLHHTEHKVCKVTPELTLSAL